VVPCDFHTPFARIVVIIRDEKSSKLTKKNNQIRDTERAANAARFVFKVLLAAII
jgi:hypothetical protein